MSKGKGSGREHICLNRHTEHKNVKTSDNSWRTPTRARNFSIPETKATEIAKMVGRAFRVLHPKRITVHVNTEEQVSAVRKPVQNLDENVTREMSVIWQEM